MAPPKNSTSTNLRVETGATNGWERPRVSYLKVNVDASSGLVDRYVGLGFIARDYEGRFVAAKNIKCRGSFGPREVEAIAVKEALSWIKSKGWKQVLVETDYKEVVDSLNSAIRDWSYFNSIIEDCKRLQSLCAGDLTFHFTPRSGNEAAHLLARSSCYDDVEPSRGLLVHAGLVPWLRKGGALSQGLSYQSLASFSDSDYNKSGTLHGRGLYRPVPRYRDHGIAYRLGVPCLPKVLFASGGTWLGRVRPTVYAYRRYLGTVTRFGLI
ncbi:hypothetical protein DM860_011817 [Cuscuta australis]|uniref:RNase H type-1 domain-containing protein n=1 Tax=Cuscuta australis TaxID=267555 RepID=A0A328DH73_9ASTE|nr:hypothetical protein DM860_011817 [Cuscuta australis]